MEQLALLNITRTDTVYRFRLDLPDNQDTSPLECVTELTTELSERLRRALQSASQHIQTAETKTQLRRNGANDNLFSLGRLLFDTLIPTSIQEALRNLDTPLLISTNTPDIPWELLYDSKSTPGYFLCQHMSISRQLHSGREIAQRVPLSERSNVETTLHKSRKIGRREAQGLSVLFLVNPTGDRPLAEEEVATLFTTLPESVSRIILYRQQANQLEMRMRMSAEQPHVLHYTGPLPTTTPDGEPVLALGSSSRLDTGAVEQLFQSLPRRPLVFLSYHEDERQNRNGSSTSSQQEREEAMEKLASNLLAAGAGAVLALRWPLNTQRTREFAVLFYQ